MNDLLKKGFMLGLGVALTSKEKVEKYVDELVIKGQIAPSEAKQLIDQLIQKGENAQLDQEVKDRLKSILEGIGLASQQEVAKLQERIEQLEHQIKREEQNEQ